MKVKVLRTFIDLSAGVERKVGDVFECEEKRFNEISRKLPDFVEVVKESAPKKTTKATKKQGK